MPKNIYLPKENYKKVEEIKEVETQIPTYEEFLKTYQVDQKVNDSYENEIESYGDIEVNRSFGPCAWRNNQYGEKWVDLRIPCPISGCSNTSTISQTHTCGEQIKISNRARVRCERCGTVGYVNSWNFSSCSNHSENYRQVDATSFVRVLLIAMRNRTIDMDFADELLSYLEGNS